VVQPNRRRVCSDWSLSVQSLRGYLSMKKGLQQLTTFSHTIAGNSPFRIDGIAKRNRTDQEIKARVLGKRSLLELCYLQLTDTSGFGGSKPVPKVRIHPAPPCSLNCRENPALVSAKLANFAHFSRFLLGKPDCGEGTTVAVARTSPAFFSAAATGSPTSSTSFGEDLAIGNRTSYEPNLTSFPGTPVPCLCPGCPLSRHRGSNLP